MMSILSRLIPHSDLRGIRAPTAPGLCLAFGSWNTTEEFPEPILAHAAGKGSTPESAALSCLGEMAENLSIGYAVHAQRDLTLTPFSGEPFPFNSAQALSRDLSNPDDPGSEGCAAGETMEAAIEGAISERIERAAIHEWWTGRTRADPIDEHWLNASGLRAHEATLRHGNPRQSSFYQIASSYPFPAIIAMTDGEVGIALGYAANPDPALAARRALEEAILQELPLLTARGKLDTNMSVEERRAVQRSAHVAGISASLFRESAINPPAPQQRFTDTVRASNLDIGYINLTHRDVQIPVIRAIIPQLPYCRPLMFTDEAAPL